MAEFSEGNAQALSFPDNSFDAAVMALVIFFVPDPAKCVGEMARVVVPGRTVSAYTWDIHGGGFPLEPFQLELAALGLKAPLPPGSDASRIDVSRRLWAAAGLEAIDTIEIPVQRTFADFDDFWTTSIGASVGRVVATMTGEDVERLKSGLRVRLPADAAGRITYGARANAIVGRLPN
jgi:SAM-dependent methyltransferase